MTPEKFEEANQLQIAIDKQKRKNFHLVQAERISIQFGNSEFIISLVDDVNVRVSAHDLMLAKKFIANLIGTNVDELDALQKQFDEL